jgi:hypothetical protein
VKKEEAQAILDILKRDGHATFEVEETEFGRKMREVWEQRPNGVCELNLSRDQPYCGKTATIRLRLKGRAYGGWFDCEQEYCTECMLALAGDVQSIDEAIAVYAKRFPVVHVRRLIV